MYNHVHTRFAEVVLETVWSGESVAMYACVDRKLERVRGGMEVECK